MPGPNDLNAWLQSIMQNQGAGQPYGAGGAPSYGTLPGGTMPGGQVMGSTATTPGQPSMGYSAMGQPGQPPAPPAPNPLMGALNALNPIGSAQAAEAEPGVWAMRHGMPQNPDFSGLLRYASGSPGGPGAGPGGPGSAGDDSGSNNPYAAAAQANPAQGGPYVGSGPPGPQMPGPAPAGVGGPYVGGQGAGPASRNMPYPGQVDPNGVFAPTGTPSDTPRPAGRAHGPLGSGAPSATPVGRRVPGAPDLGYYRPNNRFVQLDQGQNADPTARRGGPQMTALNLGGMFGGGGKPAVNPDVPAPNAQTVSSASPPAAQSNAPSDYGPLQQGNSIWDVLSKAPWNYGPPQQGNIWQGSGGPHRRSAG